MMDTTKLEKSDRYYHIRVRNEAGGTERWLLTPNEVERLRERADRHPGLLLPAPLPPAAGGWVARWLRWVRA